MSKNLPINILIFSFWILLFINCNESNNTESQLLAKSTLNKVDSLENEYLKTNGSYQFFPAYLNPAADLINNALEKIDEDSLRLKLLSRKMQLYCKYLSIEPISSRYQEGKYVQEYYSLSKNNRLKEFDLLDASEKSQLNELYDLQYLPEYNAWKSGKIDSFQLATQKQEEDAIKALSSLQNNDSLTKAIEKQLEDSLKKYNQ